MIIDLLKAVLFGIVEGITEWLPVSSTGHLILLDEFVKMDVSDEFMEMFNIVIQLGAILAVIVLFFKKLNPFSLKKTKAEKKNTWSLWFKVIVGVIPSGIIGVLLDKKLENHVWNIELFGTSLQTIIVVSALILYGIAFILIENRNKKLQPRITDVQEIDYRTAIYIGLFQCLSIIPGTSRSGSTILGAILLGVGRSAGAEFSFFLAIPTMLGYSALKIFDFFIMEGKALNNTEIGVLITAFIVSFVVSLLVIKGLMEFVRRHSFSSFGWYRIGLGILLIGYFIIKAFI